MVKVWLTIDLNGLTTLFRNEPYFIKDVWLADTGVKYAFVDKLWAVKRFDLIPDPRYAYELEITKKEFNKFNWYE
ncbi:MAG: hypothetical protein J1F35_08845 [Erysipelotrichales bacterium]|nr:hypothetical protein [Erysipelotrichales bacterium]